MWRVGAVLIVGSSNTDLVCRGPRLPVAGETVIGSSFAVFPGGKGANQAVAAARAGAAVAFAGAIGADDFGRARLAELRAEGVDTAQVTVVPDAASGVALIVVDERGENQIVVVPGANARLTTGAVDAALAARAPDALGLVLEVPLDVVAHAARVAPDTTRVVLNAAPFDPAIGAFLDQIDVLVCNATEAAGLLQREVTAEHATDAVQALLRHGCGAAVITLGSRGAVAADASGVFRVAAPAVHAVDTTGAGDACCGALLAWLAGGATLRDVVRAGVAAGALAVTREGAQPSLPWRAEVERLLEEVPR